MTAPDTNDLVEESKLTLINTIISGASNSSTIYTVFETKCSREQDYFEISFPAKQRNELNGFR